MKPWVFTIAFFGFFFFVCLLFALVIVGALQLVDYMDKKTRIEIAIDNNIYCSSNDCTLYSNLNLAIPTNTTEYSSEIALFGCNLIACLDLAFVAGAEKQGINVPDGVDILSHILYQDTTIGLICSTQSAIWIVFRGTQTMKEWRKDLLIQQIDAGIKFEGLIHEGFLQVYRSIHSQILNTLNSLAEISYLYICGQSLGGALAEILTVDPTTQATNLATYLFGTPRVGNSDFANSLDDLNIYRIVNRADIVCDLPTAISPNFVSDPNDVFLYQHPNCEIIFFEDNRSSVVQSHSIKTYLHFLNS